MLNLVLGFPVGLITGNFIEWGFHKYVLHGLGKNKSSTFSPHWHDHHKTVRKNNMVDSFYLLPFSKQIKSYEVKSLALGALSLLPLVKKAPTFVATLAAYGAFYYLIHRRAHLDSVWASKWLPWHLSHHLKKNQDQNWCVTFPLADVVLGTYAK